MLNSLNQNRQKIMLLSIATGIYLFFLIGFYPGLASYDSFSALKMAQGDEMFNPGMTYLYVGLIKLSLNIFGTTFGVILTQNAIFILSIVFLISKINVRFTSKVILMISIISLPGNWILMNGLWKDGLFISGIIIVLRFLITNELNLEKRDLIIFCFGLLLIGTSRPNGFLTNFVVIFVLILRHQKIDKMILSGIFISILTFGITVQIPRILDQPMWHIKTNIWSQFYADVVESWALGPVGLSPNESEFMDKITNKADVENIYRCEMVNTLYGITNMSMIPDNSQTIFRIWIKTLKQDPASVIHSRICRGSMILKPFPRLEVDSRGFFNIPYPIFLGQWSEAELGPSYLISDLSKVLEVLLKIVWSPYFLTLLWWGGFWFWGLTLLIFLTTIFLKWKLGGSKYGYLFIVLYSIISGLTVPAVDFRFALPQIITAIVLGTQIVSINRVKQT